MGGISLHGLNQVGDEVISLFALDIDIRPGRLYRIPESNEFVIDGDHGDDKDGNDDEK